MKSNGASEGMWIKMTPKRELALWSCALQKEDQAEMRALFLEGSRLPSAALRQAICQGKGPVRSNHSNKALGEALDEGRLRAVQDCAKRMRALASAGARYDDQLDSGRSLWEEALGHCASFASVGWMLLALEPWLEQGADPSLPLNPSERSRSNSLLGRALMDGELDAARAALRWGADPLSEGAGPSALSAAREILKEAGKGEPPLGDSKIECALLALAAGERSEILSQAALGSCESERARL